MNDQTIIEIHIGFMESVQFANAADLNQMTESRLRLNGIFVHRFDITNSQLTKLYHRKVLSVFVIDQDLSPQGVEHLNTECFC